MATWNDLGPESVPDRFFRRGRLYDNALCLKKVWPRDYSHNALTNYVKSRTEAIKQYRDNY